MNYIESFNRSRAANYLQPVFFRSWCASMLPGVEYCRRALCARLVCLNAAGMATAAGLLQIATIRKQHQAEAAGYYSGGYTGGRRYRREAGVVHEGEFVANHQAVNNSSIRPAFDLIDRAQRSNTVGSLTADDISRALGSGGGGAVVTPIVNVSNDNSEVRESLDGVNNAITILNQTLDDGLEIVMPIAGRSGLHRKLKDYERLLDNK